MISKMKWLKKAPNVVVAAPMKSEISLQTQKKRDINPKSRIQKAKPTGKQMLQQTKGGDPIFESKKVIEKCTKKETKVECFLIIIL